MRNTRKPKIYFMSKKHKTQRYYTTTALKRKASSETRSS